MNSIDKKSAVQDLLSHWIEFSDVQKRVLLALCDEIGTADKLVETSTDNLSDQFMVLGEKVSNQKGLFNQVDDQSLRTELENMSGEMSQLIGEIITQLQFQDRTNQRLNLITGLIKVIVGMVENMENATIALSDDGESYDQSDHRWLNAMIADLHLGEMRERFLRNAMSETSTSVFDQDDKEADVVDHSQASDDIELF